MSGGKDEPRRASPRRFSPWALALGAAGFAAGVLLWPAVRRYTGASVVLAHLSGLGAVAPGAVHTEDLRVEVEGEKVPARLYVPNGPVHTCIVIGHGVHHLGIEEPRLRRFSTVLADEGDLVLTPLLADLADYRITRSGADVMAGAIRLLSGACPPGRRRGALGFSFAGGLTLLAAEDPKVSAGLDWVASVGGYHDLSRVLRFLVDGTVTAPSGSSHRTPHEYGLVVLLYGFLDHFVPEADLPVARLAVRAWLEEDRERAWALASGATTPEFEALFVRLAAGRIGELSKDVEAVVRVHADELARLSPSGKLGRIPVPVYLLHGTGDSVIPREETEWAALELARRPHLPHLAVVSPLLEHVELSKNVKWKDGVALLDLVAHLL